MSISSRIRFVMAEKRIDSISELQRITGISRNALNRLYHDEGLEGLTLGTLHRICQTVEGISLGDLIEFKLPDPIPIKSPKGPGNGRKIDRSNN